MMRLQSDLDALCIAALAGNLSVTTAEWDDRAALGVVLAAEGYPGSYPKGAIIEGLADADSDGIKVFHAGTENKDGVYHTSGGRVLCVTALGVDICSAQTSAYDAADKIQWPGKTLRRDIGWRAIDR